MAARPCGLVSGMTFPYSTVLKFETSHTLISPVASPETRKLACLCRAVTDCVWAGSVSKEFFSRFQPWKVPFWSPMIKNVSDVILSVFTPQSNGWVCIAVSTPCARSMTHAFNVLSVLPVKMISCPLNLQYSREVIRLVWAPWATNSFSDMTIKLYTGVAPGYSCCSWNP